MGPKSLFKIGSVTSLIFLIWTNVAMTNVAWTNVSVTVLFKKVLGTYHFVKIGSVIRPAVDILLVDFGEGLLLFFLLQG